MCGGYAITSAPEAILRWFKLTGTPPNLPPHYNAAPGQDLPLIRLHPETAERVLGESRWGLIPHWAKGDPHGRCGRSRHLNERTIGMSPTAVQVWFHRHYAALGFVGGHSGRRTFVTKLAKKIVEAGGSLRDVQELAGHASLTTTQRYIQGSDDAKRRVMGLI
jgi:integrase